MNYKLINPDYLESSVGNDISIITELINMFREQVVEIYEEMKLNFSKGEYYQLGMLSHKAKFSIALMGMTDLADMLKTFELSAKESLNVEMYESYIERFYTDAKAAVLELDDYLSKKQNAS